MTYHCLFAAGAL